MRNRLSRILWAFLAAALCAFPLTAETKAKAVDPETKGNELYLQKNYSGAIQAWSGLIRQGQGSGKMYARLFDLGVRNLLGFDMNKYWYMITDTL